MAVTLISSPAEIPADRAPGVVVLVAADAPAAATAVAEMLGAAAPCTPSDAVSELDTRRSASSATAEAGEGLQETLDLARREAAEALAQVPVGARRAGAELLRHTAAEVHAAHGAAVAARALLGEKPEFAPDAARAAVAAQEAVARANEQREADVDRASVLLLAANGVGILVAAARVRTPAVEPLFALVAACPLAALGYLVAKVVSGTREARAAARLRTSALRSAGMATMAGLAARHARVTAWSARATALAVAEASLADARRRWATLAGSSVDATDVEALVAAVEEAGRAEAAVASLESRAARSADPPPAMVVLVEGGRDQPLDGETCALLDRLEDDTMPGMTVVVTASSEIASWAAGNRDRGGADVVDLRERVIAGLDRLRSRAASFSDSTHAGGKAAGG